MNGNVWVYDVECYSNFFSLVALDFKGENYVKYVIHESRDDSAELLSWLDLRPIMVGFNNLEFDGQIIEFFWRAAGSVTAEKIHEFMQTLPIVTGNKFSLPFGEWDMSFKQIDLFKLNHYDNSMTSLKWLEFSTRWPKLQDMPIAHNAEVTKAKIEDVLKYNTNDVDFTHNFLMRCLSMIELRSELKAKFSQPRIMNMSDSSMGSYIFEHILTKDYAMNKRELKKGTKHKEIHGRDILLDYIYFETPELQNVVETFKNRVYTDIRNKGITDESYEQLVLAHDMVYVFGSGGLHACWRAGEFLSDEDHIIMSVDVKSYYPNLAISNNFYPTHINNSFCKIYKQIYEERQMYPKGSALNYAYKIALNAVYGKSNNEHSIFFDPLYTLKITVNGQLLLAMLSEQLSKIGRIIMVNTDGIEIRIRRDQIDELKMICGLWESITNLELEYNQYDKLIVKDVNNYIAVDVKGVPKRKGMFEIYDDITESGGKQHAYNKSPNAPIIPMALFEYFVNGIDCASTVNNENNIHEFLYGIKKNRGFEYWLFKSEEGVIDIEKRSDRVIRYFITKDGYNIYKFWKDDRKNNIQAVNKGQLVTLAMNLSNPNIVKEVKRGTIRAGDARIDRVVQFDVDRDFYVREAQKMVDHINSGSRDKAYQKYAKKFGIPFVNDEEE